MNPETPGYVPEENLVLQEVAQKRVEAFDSEVAAELQEMKVLEFSRALNETVGVLEEAETNFDTDPEIEDQEGYATFLETARGYSSDFVPDRQQHYHDWIDENQDHIYFRRMFQRSQEATRIQESMDRVVDFEHEGEITSSLREKGVGGIIRRRVDRVVEQAQRGLGEDPAQIIKDNMIFKFIEDSVASEFEARSKDRPSVLDRVFGRIEVDAINEEMKRKLIISTTDANLDVGYLDSMASRFNLDQRTRIEMSLRKDIDSDIPWQDMIRDNLSEMVVNVEGNIDRVTAIEGREVNHSGLEEFAEAGGMSVDAIGAVMDDLEQVLGNPHFVREISFSSDESSYAGAMYEDGKMTLHEPRGSKANLLKTMAHEMGHSLKIDKGLQLEDAITHGVAMAKTIKTGGYSTLYSADASFLRRIEMEEVSSSDEWEGASRDYVENGSWSEELAEMVAGTLALPMYQTKYPDKHVLVERMLEKVGIDTTAVKESIAYHAQSLDIGREALLASFIELDELGDAAEDGLDEAQLDRAEVLNNQLNH